MAIKRRIALYFGAEALCLVELGRQNIINQYHVPYDIISSQELESAPQITEEIRLTAVLQKTLRDYKITSLDCFVCLPTKDIILRSFFIPRMAEQEILGAVEFEARKYIPFKLDELAFDFQVSRVKEQGQSKLRILFVGIKRDILAKYLYILEHTNLRIASLEPSPISLLRVLTAKKFVHSNRSSSAVIEVEQEQGNIIILEKGLPQFIRDFKLTAPAASIIESAEQDSLFVRLLNEIRVSLDYYRRQFPQGNFDKIIFCSERDIKSWAENLQKELNIPVVFLRPQDVLGLKEYADIGLLKAVGAGFKDYVKLPITINLSQKKLREAKEKKGISAVTPGINISAIIRWLIGASAVVFLVYLFSLRPVWDLSAQLKKISLTNAKYSGKTSADLQNLITELKGKISVISELKNRKFFTPSFTAFAKALPEGVWINNLEMQYNETEKNLNLTLKGMAYSQDISAQINLVNRFADNLKSDKQFSSSFKTIELNQVNQSNVGEYRVTNFEVNCR